MLLQDEPKLKGRLCPQPSRLISMVSKTIYYLRFFLLLVFHSFFYTLFIYLLLMIFFCVLVPRMRTVSALLFGVSQE